jgi:hypothetical protein
MKMDDNEEKDSGGAKGKSARLTQQELDRIIKKHEDFVTGVKGGMRANLAHFNLEGLSFAERNLSDADFN